MSTTASAPPVKRETWTAIWFPLARPFTLTATAVPVALGGALAAWDGTFHVARFLALLAAAMLLQAATNMLNEYFDYQRGLDTHASVGIAGTIVRGHLTAREVLRGALLTMTVALLCGLYLAVVAGPWLLAAGAAAGLAAWLYSGGPHPISGTPFGELEVAIILGPFLVGLGYAVHTGTLPAGVVIAALPVACLVAAILLGNNVRDMDGDAERGRRTVAILWGRRNGIRLLDTLLYGSFVFILAGVVLGAVPGWALIAQLALPLAPPIGKRFRSTSVPRELHPAVKGIARLHLVQGALYTAGIVLATAL